MVGPIARYGKFYSVKYFNYTDIWSLQNCDLENAQFLQGQYLCVEECIRELSIVSSIQAHIPFITSSENIICLLMIWKTKEQSYIRACYSLIPNSLLGNGFLVKNK